MTPALIMDEKIIKEEGGFAWSSSSRIRHLCITRVHSRRRLALGDIDLAQIGSQGNPSTLNSPINKWKMVCGPVHEHMDMHPSQIVDWWVSSHVVERQYGSPTFTR